MTPEQRTQLVDDLIEGVISEADFIRLEAEFSIDENARKEYYDRLALSSLLETEAASSESERIVSLPKQKSQSSWMAIAAIAIGLIVVVVAVMQLPEGGSTANLDNGPEEEQASGFAVVAGQANAVWKDLDSLADGALVPAGELELESGIAQLELFSGVTTRKGDETLIVLACIQVNF